MTDRAARIVLGAVHARAAGSARRRSRPEHRGAASAGPPQTLLRFAVPGVLVLLLVGFGAVLVVRARSEREAVRDARSLTHAIGVGMIQPRLRAGIATGAPSELAALDRYVRGEVLRLDPSLVRIKLWTREGRLVYSDEPRLIGTRAPLPADEVTALARNDVIAEVTDLSRPENRFERGQGRLLEVYLPLHTRDGTPLLFETYLHYSSVAAQARTIWLAFAPALLGALALLWLVQMPLAWSFRQRLQRHEREREQLLLGAMHASEAERRRIAGDLHDGVVQDLAGLAMTLSAAMQRARGTELEPLVARAAESTRHSMREMRSLMVDIAPVNLHDEGLEGALEDLLARLEARGVRTEARIEGPLTARPASEQVVFRAAREALRNAQQHARCATVRLDARVEDGLLVLEVGDDGRGLTSEDVERARRKGRSTLDALHDRVAEVGGRLDVESVPGAGTRLRLEVPIAPPAPGSPAGAG